jgi:hypothetical protein
MMFHRGQIIQKNHWEVMTSELFLNEMQKYTLNDLLKRLDLILDLNDPDIHVSVPFALSKQDDFIFLQAPYRNLDNKRRVQYTIKILE